MNLLARLRSGLLLALAIAVLVVTSVVWSVVSVVGSGPTLATHAVAAVESPAHRHQGAAASVNALSAASPLAVRVGLGLVRNQVVSAFDGVIASAPFEKALRDVSELLYGAVRHERPVTIHTDNYFPAIEAPLRARLPGITLPNFPPWQWTFRPSGPLKIVHDVLIVEGPLLGVLGIVSLVLLAGLWWVNRRRRPWRSVAMALIGSGVVLAVGGRVVGVTTWVSSTNVFGELALRWTTQMVAAALSFPGYVLVGVGVIIGLVDSVRRSAATRQALK